MHTTDAEIIAELSDGVGHITLNRPQALNALSLPMLQTLHSTLERWKDAARVILFDSSHPRAFCAGGDVRGLRSSALAEDWRSCDEFFSSEYLVNAQIANYPVPIVSLISGACMGGGMGLSIHGSHRIVTDSAQLAMPETAIGLFPDVGASYFLQQLPGQLGKYMGLSGARLNATDALYSGLATHYLPQASGTEILQLLKSGGSAAVQQLLDSHCVPAPASALQDLQPAIDHCFAPDTLPEIIVRLTELDTPWAQTTLSTLQSMSPQSLQVTLALFAWARGRSLAECQIAEGRTVRALLRSPDFVEGVRAVLVDKDHAPRWQPSAFSGLDAAGGAQLHAAPATS